MDVFVPDDAHDQLEVLEHLLHSLSVDATNPQSTLQLHFSFL